MTHVRRLWLAALLLWHRPAPSVGVLVRLSRLSRWRPRDALRPVVTRDATPCAATT